MILTTQSGVMTMVSPWWDVVAINPETDLEILLVNHEAQGGLSVGKFRSQKMTEDLLKDLMNAIQNELPRFDVNKWIVENYSE